MITLVIIFEIIVVDFFTISVLVCFDWPFAPASSIFLHQPQGNQDVRRPSKTAEEERFLGFGLFQISRCFVISRLLKRRCCSLEDYGFRQTEVHEPTLRCASLRPTS